MYFFVYCTEPHTILRTGLSAFIASIPLIFLEMSGADFGDTFQQAVRIFGGHREKYRLIFVL